MVGITSISAPFGAKLFLEDDCRQFVHTMGPNVFFSACHRAILASTARIQTREIVKNILRIEEVKTSGVWRSPLMTTGILLGVEIMPPQVTRNHQLCSDTTLCKFTASQKSKMCGFWPFGILIRIFCGPVGIPMIQTRTHSELF